MLKQIVHSIHGCQQAGVPLGNQPVHILGVHGPLVGQAGGQLGCGEFTAHAGMVVLDFGDGGLLLQWFRRSYLGMKHASEFFQNLRRLPGPGNGW